MGLFQKIIALVVVAVVIAGGYIIIYGDPVEFLHQHPVIAGVLFFMLAGVILGLSNYIKTN